MHNVTSKNLVPALDQLRVLHYLLSESHGKHTAHCLDFDLVTVGDDIQTASRKLDDLVKAHIEFSLATGQAANFATKAPTSYWRLFFQGKSIDLEPKTIHITIPEAAQPVAMEASDGEIGIVGRQQLVNATP